MGKYTKSKKPGKTQLAKDGPWNSCQGTFFDFLSGNTAIESSDWKMERPQIMSNVNVLLLYEVG